MADLKARFQLIDEMSDKLGSIADRAEGMLDSFDKAGQSINDAFGQADGAATQTAQACDGVAMSADSLQQSIDGATSSTDQLSTMVDSYSSSAEAASEASDYWTEAVGSYEKSALEAVYTTEELVQMGLKSADALEEQERMFDLCEQSATSLNRAMEASTDIHSELSRAVENASDVISELSQNEKVSTETKEELAKASEVAADAMGELEAAQAKAQAALENYDAVMISGTTDLGELEAAAERASHASEALAEANEKASNATEELTKASEAAAEESRNVEKSGVDAVEGIAGALVAAGITAKVTEIAQAVYELADAFSDAESTVVKATGATGTALDDLTTSMMKAYSTAKNADLESTAGAIGEINTRMGLTGDKLTEVTGLFLEYASITGSDVVGSVQNVTKVMNKWNVEMDDVEGVLDRLAYAGQISGASVDSLSNTLITGAASFQEMGLSLDNAISMLATFELYGMSGTTAITAMRTAVKNFAADGLDAETALQSVIEEIANMESASEATTLAVETFGSRAGVDMVNAIRSGALSVDTLTQSLDVADGTLQTTATTAQTLSQKWQQASNNISAAFTTAVQPTLDGISSGFAEIANGFGTFLNEHPIVTKAIVAIGVGIAALVVGIAAFTFATTVAIPAISTLAVAINAAIWPITLIAAGIAAVVAIVLILKDAFSAAEDETAGMTAATRAQYYELQDLNTEYEKACEQYGETSTEALRLKYQVDDLTAAFEASKQTVEEFTAECDALVESHYELIQSYQDSLAEINQNEIGTLALIQKLEDLATQNDKTAASEEQMKTIIDQLNEELPDLALSYDDVTKSTEATVEVMKKAAELQAEQERYTESKQAYVDLLKEQASLEEQIAKAEENVRLEQERMDNMSGWTHFWTRGEWDDLEAYQEALDGLNAAYADNQATLGGIEKQWEEVAEAEAAAAESVITWEEAAKTAFNSVEEEVADLVDAYNEAYDAARNSIDGQMGLFESMTNAVAEYAKENEISMDSMIASLESQAEYLEQYKANLEAAKDLGLSDALISELSDGSVESAAYLQTIVNNGEEKIAELNTAFEGVQEGKDQFASTVAEMETDFTEKMNAIEEQLNTTIQNMNMDTEAAEAATATIQAYINAINDQKASAVSAAEGVASAVAAALQAGNVSVATSVTMPIKGHARGTTNAEDIYVAGEDGPELIIDKGGSTVFPADETEKIINSFQTPLNIIPTERISTVAESGGSKTEERTKRILLEIAGSGEIEVGREANKETILSVMQEKLKPVLMNLIRTDILEEGELSYDY